MCRLSFIILSIFLVTFLGASDVFASVHHHHEGHDHVVASPFHKKQDGKSLHCLLNNHQHGNEFCPHSKLPSSKGKTPQLSADCGGKASGTIPSFSFHKDNIDTSFSFADLSNYSFRLFAGIFSSTQQDLNSQDPPPEVL